MIEYRKGDLFAEKHPVIAHGVNCQGVMGSGVAKIIKEKWPEVFQRYVEWIEVRDHDYRLGFVVPCPTKDGTIILNCLTQYDYGREYGKRYVSYDAVDDCMRIIDKDMRLKNFFTGELKVDQSNYIAMPKIGAGLGGGEWSIIEAIINHRLKDHKVVVYEL